MQKTGIKVAQSTVEANSGLSDLGEVLREAAILGRQNFFYDKIYKLRLGAAGNSATQFVLSGMPRYIVETALIVAIAIFVLLQTLSGDITSSAATLGVFLSGGLRLTASLLPLQSALLTIEQSLPAALRALDLLGEQEQTRPASKTAQDQTNAGLALGVSVSEVYFGYSNSAGDVLQNINLEIPAGSQAALIGPSGAGKSTLADIILGLVTPDQGKIELAGVGAADLIQSQPGLLGYVPQKPGMVSGSIAQNVALGVGVDEIDQQRLSKAISDAHLMGLVESLPNGINTDIGKRKDELSGGQLQRIGLARALYTQPKLLVMDEATSALDAESENEINKALDDLRGKVTVILIAHRLNTVQRSDIVFLMEEGKITDSGTFPELLKKNKTVQNLAQLMSIDTDSSKANQ
jgi:ATP-binding cassette subfamily C protein